MRKYVVTGAILAHLATTAWGQAIDRRVLDQVKDATVFIKLKAGRVQGSGSGFVIRVTGDTVLVMTNRHVVSPPPGELPEGAKVELAAVFRSGTAQQQEAPARVLAYDEREVRDLAVLEVRGVRQPPKPIPADQTAAEAEFSETMQVYTLGFPLGKQIQEIVDNRVSDPAITVTPMSISSLRRDEANRLARVQLSGPLIEGNSGGPIVDAKGRLVGVAVSRLRGESVGFAIPPSVVASFLAGDIGDLTAELLAPQNGQAQIKLSARLIDPLGKIKGVAIHYIRQAAVAATPHTDPQGRWPILSGGTTVPLTLADGKAHGQFSLPIATPADRKLLVQFILTDFTGRTGASRPLPIELPERPGMIAGLMEPSHSTTIPKWSCEVNLGEGVKIAHQPGSTTIELPGDTPMVNAPQFKLFNAPSALVRVAGDFQAVVRVTSDFDPGGEPVSLSNKKKLPFTFQGAGLLIWQDPKNFVRLERCKGSDGGVGLIHRILLEIYKDGHEVTTLYTKDIPERPIILAVRRKGSSLRLLFADRPDHLAVFREMAVDFDKEVFVGVSASNLSKHPLQAKFENFLLTSLDGQAVEVKPVSMSRLDGGTAVRRSDGTWVLEGAGLKVLKVTSGKAAPQSGMDQFKGQWSENRQLLWEPSKMGDALTLEVPIDAAGTYEIKGKFTLAPNYAKVKLTLDGKPLNKGKATDLYSKEVRAARPMALGKLELTKGPHRLIVTVAGKNADSSGYGFGLDDIQLVPAH